MSPRPASRQGHKPTSYVRGPHTDSDSSLDRSAEPNQHRGREVMGSSAEEEEIQRQSSLRRQKEGRSSSASGNRLEPHSFYPPRSAGPYKHHHDTSRHEESPTDSGSGDESPEASSGSDLEANQRPLSSRSRHSSHDVPPKKRRIRVPGKTKYPPKEIERKWQVAMKVQWVAIAFGIIGVICLPASAVTGRMSLFGVAMGCSGVFFPCLVFFGIAAFRSATEAERVQKAMEEEDRKEKEEAERADKEWRQMQPPRPESPPKKKKQWYKKRSAPVQNTEQNRAR